MTYNHRCTVVGNPGEGVPDVIAKIPRGGSRLAGKIARGGPPILCFIAFLLTSVLKFARGGSYIYQSPSPLSPKAPPPCVHLWMTYNFGVLTNLFFYDWDKWSEIYGFGIGRNFGFSKVFKNLQFRFWYFRFRFKLGFGRSLIEIKIKTFWKKLG